MHVREHHAPVAHLLLVSGLIALAFLACEGLHLLDHGATAAGDRPAVHGVFVPHGMFVLLAWVYGWFMVPLVLPALLVSAAFVVGPDYMTPTVALLALARLVSVMAAFELLRVLGRDARGDHGRAGLAALFAGGLLSSLVFNGLRVSYGPCCEVMDGAERMLAYATAVRADLAGLVIVMLSAMFLFRALRR
jgi:hypothetical protein